MNLMIIFQISPMRMGSTWQFNVIREILQASDIDFTSCYWGDSNHEEILTEPMKTLLIKSHFIDPCFILSLSQMTEVKVLFSLRNLHDSICSFQRISPNQDQLSIEKLIAQSLDVMHKLIDSGVDYHFTQLDNLLDDCTNIDEVKRISKFLDHEIEINKLEQISTSLLKINVRENIKELIDDSNDFNSADKISLWHGSHVATDLEQAEYRSQTIELNLEGLAEKYSKVMSGALAGKNLLVQDVGPVNFLFQFQLKYNELIKQHEELIKQHNAIVNSRIWNLSAPYRRIKNVLRRN